jgi:hypothetical protein
MPDIPISILTDASGRSPAFDQTLAIEDSPHGPEDKIQYLTHSPYEELRCFDQWLQIYRADREKIVEWLFPGGRFPTNHHFGVPSMKAV